MSNKLNKVFLQGNLVKEPDFRDFGNGNGGVCTLRIANSREFSSKGQKQEETLFVDVNTYGKLATTCRQFLSKGSEVLIEGRLHLDSWQNKDGKQNQKLDIVAENIQFMSSRKGDQSNPPRPPADHPHGRPYGNNRVDPVYAPEMPDTDCGYADDDCPF
jgi:single-strand DNA-binding protein